MIKIQLKISPSLTSTIDPKASDSLILEMELEDGATIRDLISELSFSYTNLYKVIFHPDTGKIEDVIMVVLNNVLLQMDDVIKTKLNDSDSIILLTAYTGG